MGFVILAKLVERTSGQRLDEFAKDRIFDVLGMKDAHFRPEQPRHAGSTIPVERVAPTEREAPDGRMLRGVVHDPRSRSLGGVAGHAGLFATADDLAIFAQTLLNGGLGPGGRRLLSPLAVRAMIDAGATPPGQRRALGWDVATSYSTPRGAFFGLTSFGHTGFTGTSIWIDPETETFVIILTSRLHPDGRAPSPTSLRARSPLWRRPRSWTFRHGLLRPRCRRPVRTIPRRSRKRSSIFIPCNAESMSWLKKASLRCAA